MKFHRTPIEGLWEVETEPHRDARGSFARVYGAAEFDEVMPGLRVVQINHSLTAQRGSVRGLHFQRAPALESKLIRCLRGRVFDVAVDLRTGSPTFARWHAVELAADRPRQLLIPPGCAHGFQTLSDDAELLYLHSAAYAPQCEDGVRHDDPTLAIAWPERVTALSDRDRSLRCLDDTFESVCP